ncbi:hypothetical protein [uncultured Aeromicrobium sp.]|nr:hypothetical protein [uncultured Aeromicrobium sp.]
MTDTPIRPFADWLREQSSGETHDDLAQQTGRDILTGWPEF